MTEVTHDDQLLIHYFHRSLTGVVLKWCMQLNSSYIKNWKDLAYIFIKQYQYNLEIAPTQNDLQNMEKSIKTFKVYI